MTTTLKLHACKFEPADPARAAAIEAAARDAAREAYDRAGAQLCTWAVWPWSVLEARLLEALLDLGRSWRFADAMLVEQIRGRWTKARLAAYALSLRADLAAARARDRGELEARAWMTAIDAETGARVFDNVDAWRRAPTWLRSEIILSLLASETMAGWLVSDD